VTFIAYILFSFLSFTFFTFEYVPRPIWLIIWYWFTVFWPEILDLWVFTEKVEIVSGII
jgi:hypothetical protein